LALYKSFTYLLTYLIFKRAHGSDGSISVVQINADRPNDNESLKVPQTLIKD